ncbi:XdhC family protein [Kocuria palustris]|jgi:xanthine dehydrogenase accessory factor|uniref:XdhC family protein n=1 Tax=Kocuria palustris TaxID=71999 RepID=UPI0019D07EE7|nr:XdhC/CoxI family protein [Kocuria palustris]MBN6754248.1 XdhC family protein [Kocuria palustris]MBN6759206.1 XdhC family protein [Kocuria palustris]MBN6764246.1 XdhC family protein [Kocuria palustris]MBN6783727.1 XdhC family protein [Kocuria palustris]MBN6800209.1 XdhC family protein [Kocuria palustris]
MREILNDIRHWAEPFAVATVVRTWKSSPRAPGAAMAVNIAGEVVGSVSGGCVEGDLYLRCQETLTTGTPALVRYGVSDDEAFEIGLTCGGTLEVFIHRIDPEKHALDRLAAAVEEGEPAAVTTIVEGPSIGAQILVINGEQYGSTGNSALDQAVVTDALGLLEHGTNSLVHLGRDGERRKEDVTLFVESFTSPPRMLIFGAIDFAAALARLGSFMGYRVTVCDARSLFATEARFPEADEVVVDWPHKYLRAARIDQRTVICVLTHDPKFDVPVLKEALKTDAAYIGVMGSRRTHADRHRRLREQGITEAQLARLSSPIGLDLGARTPEETAVSIGAEIIAHRTGATGRPLSELSTSIHRLVSDSTQRHALLTHRLP